MRCVLPERIGGFSLVGLNERRCFYRYGPAQEFAPHVDHWYRPSARQIALDTVLVDFNVDFRGGETAFMDQLECCITPG